MGRARARVPVHLPPGKHLYKRLETVNFYRMREHVPGPARELLLSALHSALRANGARLILLREQGGFLVDQWGASSLYAYYATRFSLPLFGLPRPARNERVPLSHLPGR